MFVVWHVCLVNPTSKLWIQLWFKHLDINYWLIFSNQNMGSWALNMKLNISLLLAFPKEEKIGLNVSQRLFTYIDKEYLQNSSCFQLMQCLQLYDNYLTVILVNIILQSCFKSVILCVVQVFNLAFKSISFRIDTLISRYFLNKRMLWGKVVHLFLPLM